ncbi:MAG: Rrf2 family transcriptional regulator [Acidimicrobiales bacterium]|nr:Rrf2 family transcriptional regulator [Acidimicrobiales bacterium]
MRITAKVDYAVRAAIELARHYPDDGSRPVPVARHTVAKSQDIPSKFLEHILADLKRANIMGSARGADGGYWLQRDPGEISVADIIRAVEGPLADVRGERPDALDYPEEMVALQRTWIAVRANLRAVLETVTLADLAAGNLPASVDLIADDPDAWITR